MHVLLYTTVYIVYYERQRLDELISSVYAHVESPSITQENDERIAGIISILLYYIIRTAGETQYRV